MTVRNAARPRSRRQNAFGVTWALLRPVLVVLGCVLAWSGWSWVWLLWSVHGEWFDASTAMAFPGVGAATGLLWLRADRLPSRLGGLRWLPHVSLGLALLGWLGIAALLLRAAR